MVGKYVKWAVLYKNSRNSISSAYFTYFPSLTDLLYPAKIDLSAGERYHPLKICRNIGIWNQQKLPKSNLSDSTSSCVPRLSTEPVCSPIWRSPAEQ